jgi:molybdopterin-guanine dinucleotide biosynthesis protein A
MPTLEADVLRLMLRRMLPASGDASSLAAQAVALESGGKPQPLPIVLSRGAAVSAASDLVASGERSLRSLVEALDTVVIREQEWRELDPGGRTLADVDEPSDLLVLGA